MKYKCINCDYVGDEMLTAINPFDPQDIVRGCPQCASVNQFVLLCDEDGCHNQSNCGWPDRSGNYRRTCGTCMRRLRDQERGFNE